MHKVFIEDRPLVFADVYSDISGESKNFSVLNNATFELSEILEKFDDKKISGILYLCARPDQAWNEFVGRFVLSEAAGGIVKNGNDELLIIYRRKKWDLPKGKLDYEETPEMAAIREVKEECGINNLKMNKFLMKTFHTYSEKNKSILKKTHWFKMSAIDNEVLIPQMDEDIEDVRWMSKETIIKKVFPKTYSSIKEVLMTYFENE